jgi:hypothetical protein
VKPAFFIFGDYISINLRLLCRLEGYTAGGQQRRTTRHGQVTKLNRKVNGRCKQATIESNYNAVKHVVNTLFRGPVQLFTTSAEASSIS